MTPDSADPAQTALPDEAQDERESLWEEARRAVASLEAAADTAPRWIAAMLALIAALLFLLSSYGVSHIHASRARESFNQVQHNIAVIDQTASTNLVLL